jgi:hypothetical protein
MRAADASTAERTAAADDDDDDDFVSERVAPKKRADAGSETERRRTSARTVLLRRSTVPALKSLCERLGFSGLSKLKKAELVDRLAAGRSRACNAHFAEADETAAAQRLGMARFTRTEDSSGDGGDGDDDQNGGGDSSDSGDEGGDSSDGGGEGGDSSDGGGEGGDARGEAAQDGRDDDSADDDDDDGEEHDGEGELGPSDSAARKRHVAANVAKLPADARAALEAGVVRGRLRLPAGAAENFADRFAHDIEQLRKDGKWLARRYTEGLASWEDGGLGPVTAYMGDKYIRDNLKAISDIVEAVVAIVGKRPVGRKGVVAIVNRPGARQARHGDSANGNARFVVNVSCRGASRWVQLTVGRGKKMRVVGEWLVTDTLDFYVMAADVRGQDYFQHSGTVEQEETTCSIVITFAVRPTAHRRLGLRPSARRVRGACVQKGVDLDHGMRGDLERHFAADAADAGAPRGGPRAGMRVAEGAWVHRRATAPRE